MSPSNILSARHTQILVVSVCRLMSKHLTSIINTASIRHISYPRFTQSLTIIIYHVSFILRDMTAPSDTPHAHALPAGEYY